jgi:NAD(P)-dependent dehydrogenase (short-subunit alcohol dehydrogenase family)
MPQGAIARGDTNMGSSLKGKVALVPLHAITEAHFDRIFATNVKGTLFTVQKALPLMKGGGKAQV